MHTDDLTLRTGTAADLDAANSVIDAAVMGWKLPERVKRLALPSYRYGGEDLKFLELVLAWEGERVVGVAAFEAADARDVPPDRHAALLHGLYVLPAHQRRGIGRRLLQAVEAHACAHGFDSLLVKAQADADGFFKASHMHPVPIQDCARDYPHRFWKSLR